jgi:Tol biopolymer transport system component
MNHKSLYRRIIIAILTVGVLVAGCAPAIRYPKIIALGFVNAGFEISVLDLSSGTRQYVTNSKVVAPTSYSYCEAEKQVAFSAFVEDGEELIFQDLTNARSEALTKGNNHFRLPVWSPDCASLAFTSYDSNPHILLLNPEDPQIYPAVLDEEVALEGASWSPDSQFIATYIPVSSQDTPRFDLGIVDLTSNKLTTRIQGLIDYPFSKIAWNADGDQIYFSGLRDTASFDIYVFDLDSGTEKAVVQTAFDDRYPLLSPDGKYLAFLQSSSVKDAYLVGLVDLSSNNPEFVTNTPMSISGALWLDNQRLILSEHDLYKNETIFYALDIKTKLLKEIRRFDGQFLAPAIMQP